MLASIEASQSNTGGTRSTFSNHYISADTPSASSSTGPADSGSEADLTPLQQRYKRIAALASVRDHLKPGCNPVLKMYPAGIKARGWKSEAPAAPLQPHKRRGAVMGFSTASARRMRLKLIAVDWPSCDWQSMCLTYHNHWSEDWKAWKQDEKKLWQRLKYRFGDRLVGSIWREEFQKRGAPHFHVLLAWQRGAGIPAETLRPLITWLWLDILKAHGDPDHEKYGVRLVDVKALEDGGLGRLVLYLSSDLAKIDQGFRKGEDGTLLETGRCWGIRGDIPIREAVTVDLTREEWVTFCDRLNKAGKGRSAFWGRISPLWSGFTLVMGPETIAQLLDGIGRVVESPGDPAESS